MLDFSVTFIITLINIAVLYFLLRAILFKPVTKFMAERTNKVQETLKQADQEKSRAKQALAECEARLHGAGTEADAIIKAARENAAAEAARIVAEGRQMAEAALAAGRRQLETERLAALTRFKADAAALVMAAASRLVVRDFSGDDQRRYANMLLEELAARGGKN